MKFLLWIAIALLAPALAAGDAPVSCRFLCFQPSADGTSKLVAKASGGAFADCPLPLSIPSGPVALEAPGGVIGFRKSAGDDATAATARIPAGVKNAFIVFLPATGKGPQLYETVVIEDSAKGFPKDGCVVLNLYQADVRFVIGEHKIRLRPGGTAALQRPAKRDDFNMSGIAFQFETAGDWRTAAESMVRFPEGQRHLFVTFIDPKTKRPRLRSFRMGA